MEACREARVEAPVEPVLASRVPPWAETASITFDLDVGDRLPPGSSAERRRQVATLHLWGLCSSVVPEFGQTDRRRVVLRAEVRGP